MIEEIKMLEDDIKTSLKNNKPELVLDRLHTLTIKVIKEFCISNEINVYNEKSELYPLHSLIGMLAKHYQSTEKISEFSCIALKQSISIFEKYNDIRNNRSYAHDNNVLRGEEAIFVINTIMNLLHFIVFLETGNNIYVNFKTVDINDIYKFICINDIVTTKKIAENFNISVNDAKQMLIELWKVNGVIRPAHIACNPHDEICQWSKIR